MECCERKRNNKNIVVVVKVLLRGLQFRNDEGSFTEDNLKNPNVYVSGVVGLTLVCTVPYLNSFHKIQWTST